VQGILPQFELHIGNESEVFTFGKVIPKVELKQGNYTLIDRDDLKLDARVDFNGESVILRGLEDENTINVTLGTNSQEEVSTSILGVPSINIENATITLEKTEGVNAIIKCEDKDFNYETLECSNWDYAGVGFEEINNTIVFTVKHFTAYAGGNLTAGETAWLTIWDENDPGMPNASQTRLINQDVKFFADYKLGNNATKITDGNCTININGTLANMNYDAAYTYYVYNRSFTAAALYPYTVSCTHSNYTDLSATDSIAVQSAASKSGMVPTTVGAVPFYTINSNPAACDIQRAGQSCTTSWLVNATGQVGTAHTFFVLYNMTTNAAYVADNETARINITISSNDTTNPVMQSGTASPSVIINGSSVNLYLTATDNVQVDQCWANVTAPDNASSIITGICTSAQAFSSTAVTGIYNVTFYANDTSGNTAVTAGSFQAAEPINATINVSISVEVNATFTEVQVKFIHPEDGEVIFEKVANGSFSTAVPNVVYDILFFGAFNSTFELRLNTVNLSLIYNKSLSLDHPSTPVSGYLATYAAQTDYLYNDSVLKIYYTGLDYSNEAELQLHKCSNWNFTGQLCSGTWTDVTSQSSQETTADYFEYTSTDLSAFSIKQVAPAPEPTPEAEEAPVRRSGWPPVAEAPPAPEPAPPAPEPALPAPEPTPQPTPEPPAEEAPTEAKPLTVPGTPPVPEEEKPVIPLGTGGILIFISLVTMFVLSLRRYISKARKRGALSKAHEPHVKKQVKPRR